MITSRRGYHVGMRIIFLLGVLAMCSTAAADAPFHAVTWRPVTGPQRLNNLANEPTVLGDRFVYDDDDATGQFYVMSPGDGGVTLALRDGAGRVIASHVTEAPPHRKAHVVINTGALAPGRYALACGDASFAFERVEGGRGVSFPEDGVPLLVDDEADVDWPLRAGVPLPPGVEGPFAVERDGELNDAEVVTRARWSPDGSAKWLHVHWVGAMGGTYRLVRGEKGAKPQAAWVREGEDVIEVETGAVRFEVSRRAFAGVSRAWVGERLVVDGSKGPYIIDGRGIRWDASRDAEVDVRVESLSSVRVVIVAEGWYANPAVKGEPLCRFKTRITAHRGSPMIQVQHHTIIAYDTRLYRLADVGFDFAPVKATGYAFGVDGETVRGDGDAFMHQDRYDHLRIVAGKQQSEGKRSDGYAAAALDGGGLLAVTLRDVWQKFPKELSVSSDSLAVHFWPAHGHRAFDLDAELDERNIYKFWCFHQHRLLDLQLPPDYYQRFVELPGTNENTPEIALMGNALGSVISDDFAVRFVDDSEELPRFAARFQRDPIARAPAEWNTSTGVLGDIAPADRNHFDLIEDINEKGFLSYTQSVERGKTYGMWNYADTHTYWNVKDDYAYLHRVWHNSHYHEAGLTWLLYYRSGSRALLDWARPSTDHYINIGTINWSPIDVGHDVERFIETQPTIVDDKVQASKNHWWLFRSHNAEQAPWYAFIDATLNEPPGHVDAVRFAVPGAMYHSKGLTHWGRKDYAMGRSEAHAWIWGHWIDPDAALWMWYLDADPRGADVYNIWHESIEKFGLPRDGVAREINTALACAVNLYEHTFDADLLPYIHGMADGLRTNEPLTEQYPGPMWHPLWVNRYYRMTRDPRYVPFILEYGKHDQLKDTWTLGLSALAYDLSRDDQCLKIHFDRLRNWHDGFYRKPGDPYDWYGQGPGPLGSRWAYMTWGHFLKQLHVAGYENFHAVPRQFGQYPCADGRAKQLDSPPSVTVYMLDRDDKPFTAELTMQSQGGDLHAVSLVLLDPDGKQLAHHEGGGPSRLHEKVDVPADGVKGLYRVETRSFRAGMGGPVTDALPEAALLPAGRPLHARRLCGTLQPLDASPVTFTVRTTYGRSPTNARLYDAQGNLIEQVSLLADRGDGEMTVTIDPQAHALPWRIEAAGVFTLEHDAEKGLLLGRSTEDVAAIADTLR